MQPSTILPLGVAILLISSGAAVPVRAQANDMFASKEAAQQRAKQLHCDGAFAMGQDWMPCKDLATYEQAIKKGS